MVIKIVIDYDSNAAEYDKQVKSLEGKLKGYTKAQDKATKATKANTKATNKQAVANKKVESSGRKLSEQLGLFNSVMGNSDTALGRMSLTAEKTSDGFGMMGIAAIGAGLAFSVLGPVIGEAASALFDFLKAEKVETEADRIRNSVHILTTTVELQRAKLEEARLAMLAYTDAQKAFNIVGSRKETIEGLKEEQILLEGKLKTQQEIVTTITKELEAMPRRRRFDSEGAAMARERGHAEREIEALLFKQSDLKKKLVTAEIRHSNALTVSKSLQEDITDELRKQNASFNDRNRAAALGLLTGIKQAKEAHKLAKRDRLDAAAALRLAREGGIASKQELKELETAKSEAYTAEVVALRNLRKLRAVEGKKRVNAHDKRIAAEKAITGLLEGNALLEIALIDDKTERQEAYLRHYDKAITDIEDKLKKTNLTEKERLELQGKRLRLIKQEKTLIANITKSEAQAVANQSKIEEEWRSTTASELAVLEEFEIYNLRKRGKTEKELAKVRETNMKKELASVQKAGALLEEEFLALQGIEGKELERLAIHKEIVDLKRDEIRLLKDVDAVQKKPKQDFGFQDAFTGPTPDMDYLKTAPIHAATVAYQGLTDVVGESFDAWITGAEGANLSFEKMLHSMTKALAQEALMQGLKEVALMFGSIAMWDGVGAAKHAAAAAAWGALAAATGGVARATAPPADTGEAGGVGSTRGSQGEPMYSSDGNAYITTFDLDPNPRATVLKIRQALAKERRSNGSNSTPHIVGE